MDLSAGERAVHRRSRLAFAAAAAAGLPGRFEAFEREGLRALLTTSPGLGFLNSVTGVDARSVPALPEVLAVFAAAGAPVPVVVGAPHDLAPGDQRTDPDTVPGPVRPIAVLALASPHDRDRPGEDLQVRPAVGEDLSTFFEVLSAGYAAPAQVDRFVLAEHADPAVLRFLAWKGHRPVAAAAMSLHDDMAVLGGATTLATHRGDGAQTALLHHRLAVAAASGARGAVATAAPASPSIRNLARSGFIVHLRPIWLLTPSGRTRRA